MRVVRALGLAILALPLVAAKARAPQAPFGDVTLTATPAQYEGKCPVRINFFGHVGVTAHPMVFNYHYERSDGAKGQVKVVRVTNPNATWIGVHDYWQLGASGQTYHVWEKLFVYSGNTHIATDQAVADITCK